MEILRSVMARPNLSVNSMSLAGRRWSLAQPRKLDIARYLVSGRDTQAGTCSRAFPFQWLLMKPGGAGVSSYTLGRSCGAGALARETLSTAATARVFPKAEAVGNSISL